MISASAAECQGSNQGSAFLLPTEGSRKMIRQQTTGTPALVGQLRVLVGKGRQSDRMPGEHVSIVPKGFNMPQSLSAELSPD